MNLDCLTFGKHWWIATWGYYKNLACDRLLSLTPEETSQYPAYTYITVVWEPEPHKRVAELFPGRSWEMSRNLPAEVRWLKIRNLIASREFNTACANRELQTAGAWLVDHEQLDTELNDEIERLMDIEEGASNE